MIINFLQKVFLVVLGLWFFIGEVKGQQNLIYPPEKTVYCVGEQMSTITGSDYGPGALYQWERSRDGGASWEVAPIYNGNKDYPPSGNGIVVVWHHRRGVRMNTSQPWTYNTNANVVLQVVICSEITTPATDYCEGESQQTITGSSYSSLEEYQWQVRIGSGGWTNVGTGQHYTPISAYYAVNSYQYRRITKLANTNDPAVTSDVVTLTVVSCSNTITAPSRTLYCENEAKEAIVGSVYSTSGSPQYQWQSSPNGSTWSDISGGTFQNYIPTSASGTLHYRRGARLSGGTTWTYNTPETNVHIQVLSCSNTITTPSSSYCVGEDKGQITGSQYSVAPSDYQWQSSDGTFWNDITGATGQNYTPPSSSESSYYRRGARVQEGSATWDYSSSVLIAVSSCINTITAPSRVNYCAGEGKEEITGSEYSIIMSDYQWQSSPDNTTWGNITGATGQNYTPPGSSSTLYYRRGAKLSEATTWDYSSVVLIRVESCTNTITAPNRISYCQGEEKGTITGSIYATTGAEYQWQSSMSANGPWYDIIGSTGYDKDYTPTSESPTSYYRRGARVQEGSADLNYSSPVLITVSSCINQITAPIRVNYCEDEIKQQITGSEYATVGVQYIWQSGTSSTGPWSDIPGSTNQHYTPSATSRTLYYRRGARIQPGPVALDYSSPVLITVESCTNTITAPSKLGYCPNESKQNIAGSAYAASGAEYQWESSPNGNNPWTIIASGGTGQNYTPPASSGTLWYRRGARIGNSGAWVYNMNANVLITVNTCDNTITAPTKFVYCPNETKQSIVGSNYGNVGVEYQWQSSSDGSTGSWIDINGAVSNDYTPTPESSTLYYRRGARLVGYPWTYNTTSSNVLIMVESCNNILTAPSRVNYCESESKQTIQGSNYGAGSRYQWESSPDGNNPWTVIASGGTGQHYAPPAASATLYYRRGARMGTTGAWIYIIRIVMY